MHVRKHRMWLNHFVVRLNGRLNMNKYTITISKTSVKSDSRKDTTKYHTVILQTFDTEGGGIIQDDYSHIEVWMCDPYDMVNCTSVGIILILFYSHRNRLMGTSWSWPSIVLVHRGRVTHICVHKLAIIDSNNGLLPGRRQAIIWTNAGIVLIGTLGTITSEILSEMYIFSFKKMHLKILSAKWRVFCLGFNLLSIGLATHRHILWTLRISLTLCCNVRDSMLKRRVEMIAVLQMAFSNTICWLLHRVWSSLTELYS